MNNQELQQLIADYLHRTDLAALIPTWIDMARQRIGRDLRSQYNQVVLDPFSTTAQISPLPADYRGMKEISYTQGVARIQLRGGSVDALAAYAQTGIGTRWYRVDGMNIETVPYQARDYRMIYFSNPSALVVDTDTNDVLTNYPYLYLYAALVEGFFYTQDAGGREKALENYTSEVSELNRQSANADAGAQLTMGNY